MKKKYIVLFTLLLLLGGCSDDDSLAKNDLQHAIQEAETVLAESEEGLKEGDYAPGSKSELQTSIDWAYFILGNSCSDEAYSNAVSTLKSSVDIFYANIVKAGIPYFSLGAKMNLGPCGDWNLDAGFTFECRVNYTEFASGVQNIISCEGGSGGWMLRASGSVVQFYINDAGGWNGCVTPELELNRWYHIAVSYKPGGEIVLYLDGKKVGSSPCTILSFTPTTDLQIGTSPSYADRYMRGYIQDVSLWQDVRTEQEVVADTHCDFSGTEEGLNAYWPLNLNLGAEIKDVTDNHVAVMTNLTWYSETNHFSE